MKATLEILDLDKEVDTLGPLLVLIQSGHIVAIFAIEELEGAKWAAEDRVLMMGSPVTLYEVHLRFAADGTVSGVQSEAGGWTRLGHVIPPNHDVVQWE